MIDWSVALQSATILLREGLEAMLVVAALAAFLRRSGAEASLRPLYSGALAAVVASFGAAWVFERFFDGAHSDLLEAGIMILAAGLMFYMSGWLVLRQDPRAWQAELRRAAEKAVGEGAAWSIAAIAFLAVFREGGETILFLHALAKTAASTTDVVVGLIAAALALVVLFVALDRLAMQLPLKPVFLVTSAILFAMGLKMVGDAVQELQEQALIPFDTNSLSEAARGFGTNGSMEALFLQLAILAAAALCYMLALRPRLRQQPQTE